MKARGLNPNTLAEYGVKQRTLADVLLGADPRLSTIHAAAKALGMKTADLLREGEDRRITAKVTDLHPPRSPIIPPNMEPTSKQDRKKHRR